VENTSLDIRKDAKAFLFYTPLVFRGISKDGSADRPRKQMKRENKGIKNE